MAQTNHVSILRRVSAHSLVSFPSTSSPTPQHRWLCHPCSGRPRLCVRAFSYTSTNMAAKGTTKLPELQFKVLLLGDSGALATGFANSLRVSAAPTSPLPHLLRRLPCLLIAH